MPSGRDHSAEALAAFAALLDELAISSGVQRAAWFGTPAAKVEGKIFLALWHSSLVARIGAEEVDARVLAGDGVRFDPSGKGRAMKDWLESNAEPAEFSPGRTTEVIVLKQGRKLAEGTPEVVRRHPEVVEAYLGAEA